MCTKVRPWLVLYSSMYTEPMHQQAAESNVPPGLYQKVMLRITSEQRRRAARLRLLCTVGPFAAAVGLMLPVWRSFQVDIVQSGFAQYVALAFSDFRLVAAQWQDYSLSLLESLPVTSTVELITVLLCMLLSLRLLVRYGQALLNFIPSGAAARSR